VEVARDLERRIGLPYLFIAGYTNGTAGYFPTREQFDFYGYEVGQARFVPDAVEVVTEEAVKLVRGLY
jgi:hypothetical protein